jgi:threonyl-tRNA synthetase
VLPEKLDAEVVKASGARVRPVMIHQAVLGSIERFMAILVEHHRGNLPFWVAPEQIVVAPVSSGQLEYARAAAERFHTAGFRCLIDEANETLSRRIVAAHNKGIPIFTTVGPKEVSAGTVTIRERGGVRSTRSLSDATDWLKAINPSE